MMYRAVFLASLLTLISCTPRGHLAYVAPASDQSQEYQLYYATTRALSEDPFTGFDSSRASEPTFGKMTVAVPPNRIAGGVTYPSRNADPAVEFTISASETFTDMRSFQSDISTALASQPENQQDAVIFVHGFNNTFAEGMFRLAQLDHDLAMPGVSVHYAWPSLSNPFGYSYDRDSALFGRDGLEALIKSLHAAGAQDVIIIAHSMGSLLVMETLRQMEIADDGSAKRLVQGVIFMSPDLDVELFRAQARRIGELPQPFLIFTSRRDRALQLSARLTGQRERLGNLSDVERVSDLDVFMLDVTNFEDGSTHLTAATSPTLLSLLGDLETVDSAFQGEVSARPGLLPGTVMTVQNATQIILTPNTTLIP